MVTPLEENSVLFIALAEWVPPAITIILGGLFASILLPRWQNSNARYHAREARRLALAEELARNFTRYTSAWRRLRQISQLETERSDGLTPAEFERKTSYIQARRESRDALFDTFCSVKLYFSTDVYAKIEQFVEWDEQHSGARLDELPPHDEWHRRRETILRQVYREIAR